MINESKLKMKYIFNVYDKMTGFPTIEDTLYELVKYLNKRKKGNVFTEEEIKFAFSFNPGIRKIKEILIYLINMKYVEHDLDNDNYVLVNNIFGD